MITRRALNPSIGSFFSSAANTARQGLGKAKGYSEAPYEMERHTLSGLPEKLKRGDVFTVLGIESSCDDTGVAVVRSDGTILSNIVYSQYSVHEKFGGIVPSLAMEAHSNVIDKAVEEAISKAGLSSLEEVDAIAVTKGPGLEICLRVGCRKAQELALKYSKPFVTVHHLEAHCLTARLAGRPVTTAPCPSPTEESGVGAGLPIAIPADQQLRHFTPKVPYPFLALLVSGGHTNLMVCRGLGLYEALGGTLDDSAGEAFDKAARLLGLPLSSSGGAAIEAAAAKSKYAAEDERIRTKAMEILKDYREKLGSSVSSPKSLSKNEKDIVREYKRSGPHPAAATQYKMRVPLKDRKDCDFSYSGLKNSFRVAVGRQRALARLPIHSSNAPQQQMKPVADDSYVKLPADVAADLSYCFQSVAFQHLSDRVANAMARIGTSTGNGSSPCSALVVVGGVAANQQLRRTLLELLQNNAAQQTLPLVFPPVNLCTDNGVMVAWTAIEKLEQGISDDPTQQEVTPRWPLGTGKACNLV